MAAEEGVGAVAAVLQVAPVLVPLLEAQPALVPLAALVALVSLVVLVALMPASPVALWPSLSLRTTQAQAQAPPLPGWGLARATHVTTMITAEEY